METGFPIVGEGQDKRGKGGGEAGSLGPKQEENPLPTSRLPLLPLQLPSPIHPTQPDLILIWDTPGAQLQLSPADSTVTSPPRFPPFGETPFFTPTAHWLASSDF